MILLNLVLAGLRLGLKNRQAGEKWIFDDYSYLCKGLFEYIEVFYNKIRRHSTIDYYSPNDYEKRFYRNNIP
ncbi:IS3 family transposase [Bathymodiolus heckerae thiotrophic gill symbiont]|uniref:IS3 family transposase n=1 Tax=Bathymodiolus heckerae thiotrophic gill symbiont TaxID=1052212 RepID=UPI0010B85236|nr:IS3 family transposase [Bathymodiolus heckerae thiotrophic gill symbiont]SMN13902.1 hypothetical protein BHECKSOX2_1132 [Bathymodiolus heckerae thiotrophic gill symbiont]